MKDYELRDLDASHTLGWSWSMLQGFCCRRDTTSPNNHTFLHSSENFRISQTYHQSHLRNQGPKSNLRPIQWWHMCFNFRAPTAKASSTQVRLKRV